jgi:hypothetical protein
MTRVVVYPSDSHGCGYLRMIAPAQALIDQGHDVEVVRTQDRRVRLHVTDQTVTDVEIDADLVVFQRLTHPLMAQAVPILRSKGVAVVVDVDDDLTSIHPSNPAFESLRPGSGSLHSWRNLSSACRDATLVTVSTPALLDVYARHGRGHVLYNRLPDDYRNLAHTDSDVLGWPASFHSHPNDPEVMGGSVARLVADGAVFRTVGESTGAGRAFGLSSDPPGRPVPREEWPAAVAELGVGVAPLADTKFNAAKSWLKPLEMCAAGVPWVASPRAEYVRLHRMGAGVLADRPRVWHREIRKLLDSPALREEQSEAGRIVAEQNWLSDHAWRWAEAWDHAMELQRETVAA